MLSGFGGHLVSESYLERCIERRAAPDVDRRRRELAAWRTRCRALGPASPLRSMLEIGAEPMLAALGHDRPSDVLAGPEALFLSIPRGPGSGAAPYVLVVAAWGARMDALWRPAVVEARRRGAGWCVVFNGTHVRLIGAGRLYSRRFAEFDLDLAVDDDRACLALHVLFGCHGGSVTTSLDDLIEGSDRHASGVCRSLRDGVLAASSRLLEALLRRSSKTPADSAFEQALTIVYRILFLLFAEARHLVPLWHPVYRESYSLDALGAAAFRDPVSAGLWEAIRAACRLAHDGCEAGDLRVTPFNGRLFAPARAPLAERRDLEDRAAREALIALATQAADDGEAREPISYRDLGVEQLGAVYEALLDYAPQLEPRTRAVTLESGTGRRKATSTFYTPQSITHYLVRQALGPLVRDAPAEGILALRVLDPAMGSGAFLVASCTFLADAYEAALVRDGHCHPQDLGPSERAAIRRSVAERCLFGVDLNPMAVQLARLSLWLATLAADRPLSFLDHHLQTGDSILGAWVASVGRSPRLGRFRDAEAEGSLFEGGPLRDALRLALPVRFSLAVDPNDTPEQVRRKDRALEAMARPDTLLSKWKRIANLWCSYWFANRRLPRSAFAALSDSILTGRSVLPSGEGYLAEAEAIAHSQHFFHWELEFPEAFFDRDGARLPNAGFDAVVGNPPWDMIRADTGDGEARTHARTDARAVLRFTRDSGTYHAQSDGHANRYQLFVERAVALARSGGRIGLVLPSGFASDHGSAPLRRWMFDRCAVDTLVGFDNRDGVFPIHRSVRFLLLTATPGARTTAIRCRLGERNPSVLDREGAEPSWFPLRVTPALLSRVSGDALALPEFRSPLDLAIAERVAELFPPLGASPGWNARFSRELNATDDRQALASAGNGLPVLEGKHLEPFRATASKSRWTISPADAERVLGRRYQRRRLGYRDVASPTNRVTLIAALLPAFTVSTHTIFCLRTPLPLASQHGLCGLFNSFVLNFLVRLRVTTHVTTAIVERLPIPPLDQAEPRFREICALARLLAKRPSPRASACLNACVARLYGFTAAEYEHVLGTFPLVPREEREQCFQEFERASPP
jgi:hypothetical protein